jgi:hypothetical protein
MLFLQICSPTPTESREIEILPISHKGLGFQPKSFNWRPNLEFEESRSSTKMRRRLLQPGYRRDSGTRRGVERCCRSLGRGVRACTTSWRARGGVNLGGGGNHGGARQGRLGKDARDGRRCINRPGSRGHDIGGEMLPCYGALWRARIRTGPRTARRSTACTARVRRGDREARGARAPMHHEARADLGKEHISGGVRPRSAVALGADAEEARARRRLWSSLYNTTHTIKTRNQTCVQTTNIYIARPHKNNSIEVDKR